MISFLSPLKIDCPNYCHGKAPNPQVSKIKSVCFHYFSNSIANNLILFYFCYSYQFCLFNCAGNAGIVFSWDKNYCLSFLGMFYLFFCNTCGTFKTTNWFLFILPFLQLWNGFSHSTRLSLSGSLKPVPSGLEACLQIHEWPWGVDIATTEIRSVVQAQYRMSHIKYMHPILPHPQEHTLTHYRNWFQIKLALSGHLSQS